MSFVGHRSPHLPFEQLESPCLWLGNRVQDERCVFANRIVVL